MWQDWRDWADHELKISAVTSNKTLAGLVGKYDPLLIKSIGEAELGYPIELVESHVEAKQILKALKLNLEKGNGS